MDHQLSGMDAKDTATPNTSSARRWPRLTAAQRWPRLRNKVIDARGFESVPALVVASSLGDGNEFDRASCASNRNAREATLEADLRLTGAARGIVLFAHGSGSSRFSPRNREVAEQLNAARLATLLVDLLTADEAAIDERTRQLRFDIGLLADRLVDLTDWLGPDERTAGLNLGHAQQGRGLVGQEIELGHGVAFSGKADAG